MFSEMNNITGSEWRRCHNTLTLNYPRFCTRKSVPYIRSIF